MSQLSKKIPELDFLSKKDNFLTTSIFAGCDYLTSIKGIGFKTAYKYLKEYDFNVKDTLTGILIQKRKFEVPKKYFDTFKQAFLTFKF